MIYSLTLGKIRAEKSGWPVFVFFVLCILVACLFPAPDTWVVGQAALSHMQDSRSHYLVLTMFLGASIAVPFFSAIRVEKKKQSIAERRKVAEEEKRK